MLKSWVGNLAFSEGKLRVGQTDVSRIGGEGEKWSVNYCSHSVSRSSEMGEHEREESSTEEFARLICSDFSISAC